MWSILFQTFAYHASCALSHPEPYFMCTYVHAVDACGHDLSSHTLYMYHKVRVDSLCDKNFGIFSLNMLFI